MITYTNIQRFDNLSFETYRKISDAEERRSFSNLNKERYGQVKEIEVTDKMRIGSLVDGILTAPTEVNIMDPLYDVAKSIAHDLKHQFGSMIKAFEKQISYFATMEYMGHRLKTNGRLDFLLPKIAVIDLKVCSSKYVMNYQESVQHIERMGYDNQVWHYCRLAQVKKGYIMMYLRSVKNTLIIPVHLPERNEWMEQKILKLGTPLIEIQ